MKNFFFSSLTLLFMLGIIQTGEAKLLEVQGDIVLKSASTTGQASLQSNDGDFKLVNLNEQELGCAHGVFWLMPEFAGNSEETYRVVEVVQCLDQTDVRDIMVCNEMYAPVCGLERGQPVTFGNLCELEFNRAEFIENGECLE